MDRPHASHGRGRDLRRVLVCGAATLSLGLAPAAAWAEPADETALPQITDLAGTGDPCAADAGRVVDQRPWTHEALGLDEVHALGGGSGVTVAVLATGLDANTPALEGAVEGGGTAADCRGFGTFLAGVVAARPQADSGFVGVAPGARVLGVGTGDPATGEVTPAGVAASIRSAVDSGARVVLVGTAATEASDELAAAVAAAEEAGVLVVAPASVWLSDGARPGHPAQEPTVVSVAAHGPEGSPVVQEVLLTPGEVDPARVDLIAPGAQVLGIGPGGEGHRMSQGDGVAAAFVAGTAALLLSREPDLTPDQVRDRLAATAYPSALGAADAVVGHGRLDSVGALTGAPGGPGGTVAGEGFVPDPSPLGTVDPLPVALASGGAVLVMSLAILGRPVLAAGKARGWRAARRGELD